MTARRVASKAAITIATDMIILGDIMGSPSFLFRRTITTAMIIRKAIMLNSNSRLMRYTSSDETT